MVRGYVIFILMLLLIACSDKSKDALDLGKIAYDSGKLVEAKALFMQVDSLSQWNVQARIYLGKIDSLSALTSLQNTETTTQETTYDDGLFTEQEISLDTSQYQLIDKACAIYFLSREERSEQQAREIAEVQRSDSVYMAEHPDDSTFSETIPDHSVWYGYVYQSQFAAIESLGIPTVRLKQDREYIRFTGSKDGPVIMDWSKSRGYGEECIILYKPGKKPICNCNDEEGVEAKKYFTED